MIYMLFCKNVTCLSISSIFILFDFHGYVSASVIVYLRNLILGSYFNLQLTVPGLGYLSVFA